MNASLAASPQATRLKVSARGEQKLGKGKPREGIYDFNMWGCNDITTMPKSLIKKCLAVIVFIKIIVIIFVITMTNIHLLQRKH